MVFDLGITPSGLQISLLCTKGLLLALCSVSFLTVLKAYFQLFTQDSILALLSGLTPVSLLCTSSWGPV